MRPIEIEFTEANENEHASPADLLEWIAELRESKARLMKCLEEIEDAFPSILEAYLRHINDETPHER